MAKAISFSFQINITHRMYLYSEKCYILIENKLFL